MCVGAIAFAKTFALVGDSYQLPPLVQSERAKRAGMDVSLFSRLASAHPEAVVALSRQYRMNQDICDLSNELVYSGRLQVRQPSFPSSEIQFHCPSPIFPHT